jgi:hypothetical protein
VQTAGLVRKDITTSLQAIRNEIEAKNGEIKAEMHRHEERVAEHLQ